MEPLDRPVFSRRAVVGGALATGVSYVSRNLLNAQSHMPASANQEFSHTTDGARADASLFYRPVNAWVGDTIPFYQDGVYHIFYLRDWRDPEHRGRGSTWYKVTTRDFVHFEDAGEMIPKGTTQEQDMSVATGSVLHPQGRYHAFYTGYNSIRAKQGHPEQGICHAVSADSLHWTKVPADTFFPDPALYGMDAWRDPFVFWNEQAGEYWMLCAARLSTGPHRRRGCTALCTSRDLREWKILPPLYAPSLFEDHECPDLFQIGEWWYLIFSEFSDQTVTRYRMAHSPSGPWITPTVDTFDGRAFYAAKTAGNEYGRFLFGWIPTRHGNRDDAFWDWGGNLGIHEIVQAPEGTLSIRLPFTIRQAMATPFPFSWGQRVGDVAVTNGEADLQASERFAVVSLGELPSKCRIDALLSVSARTRRCGLTLHGDPTLDSGYSLRFDLTRDRVVVELYPRPDGNSPYLSGLERPFHLQASGALRVSILVDGDIAVAYIDDKLALTSTMLRFAHNILSTFVEDGTMRVNQVEISLFSE